MMYPTKNATFAFASKVLEKIDPLTKRPRQQKPIPLRQLLQLALLLGMVGGLSLECVQPVSGITINLTFNDPYGDPNDPRDDDESRKYYDINGVDRTKDLIPIMKAAASMWQDIIETPGTIDITYQWGNLGGTLGGNNSWRWGGEDNRVDSGTITLDTLLPSGGARRWFFDETPDDDSEFNMSQTLYRDLDSDNQVGGATPWFRGNVPEELEASYRGAYSSSAPDDARLGWDLLSVALHELGHAIGVPGTDAGLSDGDYDVNPDFVRGNTMAIMTDGNDHLPIPTANMSPGIGPGVREMVSAVDVFAAASTSGWTTIDLQRQDFIAASSNNTWTSSNWMGNQNPGSLDDAYIRSQRYNPTVELVGTARARNLFVGDGDDLSTNAFLLDIGDTVTIDGSGSRLYVDSGGRVEADTIRLQNRGELRIYEENFVQGEVYVDRLEIGQNSFVRGAGGQFFIDERLVNDGTISTLTSGFTTLFYGDGSTVFDLDGDSSKGVVTAYNSDLSFLNGSFKTFNSSMVVAPRRAIYLGAPFNLGTNGSLDLQGGTTASERSLLSDTSEIRISSDSALVKAGSGFSRIDAPLRLERGKISVASDGDLEMKGSAQIFGGEITVAVGGKARFEGDTQLFGGKFSTSGTRAVQLNGATEYGEGTITVNGRVHQNGNATVKAPTTITGTGTWDMDGNDGGNSVWYVNDDLTLNTARLEDSSLQKFDGRIDLSGSGTTMSVNIDGDWIMDGRLTVRGGTALAGTSRMNLTGEIFAQSGEINAPVAFENGGSVVVSAGEVLKLNGPTDYRGGAYRGGTIQQNGEMNVTSNTRIGANFWAVPTGPPSVPQPTTTYWLDNFDWNPTLGPSVVTNISPGVSLTINAQRIDDGTYYGSGGVYEGVMNIDGGVLIMNTAMRTAPVVAPLGASGVPNITPTQWTSWGTINLREVDGNQAIITSEFGSPLKINAKMNVLAGDSRIEGIPLTLDVGGEINVAQGARLTTGLRAEGEFNIDGQLVLSKPSTMVTSVEMNISDNGIVYWNSDIMVHPGTYRGNGKLVQNGDATFKQNVRLDVFTEFQSGTNTIPTGYELRLGREALIHKDATFFGGTVHNLAGSTLAIDDQADMDTRLYNEGSLELGEIIGDLKVDDFVQTTSGALGIDLGGLGIGSFDRLIAQDSVELAGELAVSLVNEFVPSVGDSFDIMFAFGGLNGMFDSVTSTLLNGGSHIDWGVNYSASVVSLEVLGILPNSNPGDFNNDGHRDGRDFLAWQRGKSPKPASNSDLMTWQENYGSDAPLSVNFTAVPEPTTIWLAAIALLCFLPRSVKS